MPTINGLDFKKHIKNNESSMVYLLYGKEKYMLKNSQTLLEKSLNIDTSDVFSYSEFTNASLVDSINDAVMSVSFMSENKMVVVKDFDIEKKSETELKKLYDMLNNLNESTILVFSSLTIEFNEKKSKKWTKFINTIAKIGLVSNFEPLTDDVLIKFIQKEAKKFSCEIENNNAKKIIEYVGSDMKNIQNEVTKLCSFSPNCEISADAIENIVVKNLEASVFELTKAIFAGNFEKAYFILNTLFYNKENAVNIFVIISDAFVDLYRVKAAIQSGKSSLAPAQYGNYANNRKYKLLNSEKQAKNFSTEKLCRCLNVLREADLSLKSSKISDRIVVEKLIADLLLITKGDDKNYANKRSYNSGR